jgi:LysR family nitrogen assimilation transcriptional regulator
VNLSTVKLFLEVAEAGSLSKVAARRQTVQSHVSRQITEFEAECGGRLFRRTGRGVELTDLGGRAVTQLRAWVQHTEQIEQDLRSASGCLLGEVRLGIIP